MRKICTILATLMVSACLFSQKNYTMDKYHSRLGFTATHFAISHVDGHFTNFNASLKASKDDLTDAVISMTAEAKSINTGVDMRDKDLRSPDWLDVDKFKVIEFKSTSFRKAGEKQYKLEGNLTIRGVTKPIVFDVSYNGTAVNHTTGKNSVGFTVTGMLNRKDFGVGTDALEKVVGKEIELKSNIEFIIEP